MTEYSPTYNAILQLIRYSLNITKMRSFDFGLISGKLSLRGFVIKMFFQKYKNVITLIHNSCMCDCVEGGGRVGQEVE